MAKMINRFFDYKLPILDISAIIFFIKKRKNKFPAILFGGIYSG